MMQNNYKSPEMRNPEMRAEGVYGTPPSRASVKSADNLKNSLITFLISLLIVLLFIFFLKYVGILHNRTTKANVYYVNSNYHVYKARKTEATAHTRDKDVIGSLKRDTGQKLKSDGIYDESYIVQKGVNQNSHSKRNAIRENDNIATKDLVNLNTNKERAELNEQQAMLLNVLKNPLLSNYYATVGLHGSKETAEKKIKELSKMEMFSKYILNFSKKSINGREYFIVKAGPFASNNKAEEFCLSLEQNKITIDCFTVDG